MTSVSLQCSVLVIIDVHVSLCWGGEVRLIYIYVVDGRGFRKCCQSAVVLADMDLLLLCWYLAFGHGCSINSFLLLP
jgi:hypothetical protein